MMTVGRRTTSWAGSDADPNETLLAYQKSLPVTLIATPRSKFIACDVTQEVGLLVASPQLQTFDHLPVIDSRKADEPIVGVLPLASLRDSLVPRKSVQEKMEPLCEEHLIGADASIVSFIEHADSSPFRLIVADRQVTALVSISDLQRLPVRAALFAMITHLEMTMSKVIQQLRPTDWQALMSARRKEMLEKQIERARKNNTLIEPLLYTQFCDKRDILDEQMRGFPTWPKTFEKEMRSIERLRNELAHANEFANTRERAHELCDAVRTMSVIITALSELS